MRDPNFQDRIERNYRIGITESEIAPLWRDLRDYLPAFGLKPIYKITCVASVYFDNRDFDLTRYTILNGGRHLLVRLRTYEDYGEHPTPISEYWVEVKIREGVRWRKKRFKLKRADLDGFLKGQELRGHILEYNNSGLDPAVVQHLYEETQETILTNGLAPVLLLTYRRIAFQKSEIERVCLDSDIQYYHASPGVLLYDSWKYPLDEPAGRSGRIILELKYPQSNFPEWVRKLEERYPIYPTNFSKYVEGMGCLFNGPLRHHREATYFIPRIDSYMISSERL